MFRKIKLVVEQEDMFFVFLYERKISKLLLFVGTNRKIMRRGVEGRKEGKVKITYYEYSTVAVHPTIEH
jgi:hypothetical protein